MKDKTVLITGATKGLGKLLAGSFAESGYGVIGTDLVGKQAIPQEFSLRFTSYYPYDLRDLRGIKDFIENVCSRHEIDVVVNNACVLDFRLLEEYNDAEVIDAINVNLTAAILVIKNFLPHFMRRKYGRIVNISSNSAYRGVQTTSLYASSKAGMNLLAESLKKELQTLQQNSKADITINTICPSRIDTDEYLQANPDASRNELISNQKVFQKILEIINSRQNGRVVQLFDRKFKYYYLKEKLLAESFRLLFKH